MEKRIMGVKCTGCGKVFYPKRACCPDCGGKMFEEICLGDECILLTFTKLYALPEGIERVPLVLGIVEFANAARAVGQITEENVTIGMKLRPIWGLLRNIDGKEVYGFKFKPI
ncbi:MAG: zinc ribbon domain-containing protein [Candidatus Bathyarchaeota archaeon]|nr:zinc ribbon domain-containing protein [Candidatus Bathyarchaeota archaeon]